MIENTTIHDRLAPVPAEYRQTVATALATAFGPEGLSSLIPLRGGASGALLYQADIADRQFVVRVETRLGSPFRIPHQYVCMQAASDAGIAPPLRFLDADAGVSVMDCVTKQPLTAFPGGPLALTRELGFLMRRLQETAVFPQFRDYRFILERLLGVLQRPGFFAPGLLDAHAAAFNRIREAYPWGASALVSAHNDPNPQNILFDGERLWLIDWETAYANDALTDVAILADNFAATPELEDSLLSAWLGASPDRRTRARLHLMRQLTRLYYAGMILSMFAGTPRPEPDTDLTAPTPDAFRAAIAEGRIKAASPELLYTLGKIVLARFLAGVSSPDFDEAVAIVQHG
jgi:phosphotransferase family enzyme